MSTYTATVTWKRGEGEAFTDRRYSRAHTVSFDGGVSIAGSSAPSVVKLPLSREDAADPEEMLVASLSMCHMLFFLDFAARAGFVVDTYVDSAEGVMERDERGKTSMTRVTLKPQITWSGDTRPTADDVASLHHKAHDACYIANSFRGEVSIA